MPEENPACFISSTVLRLERVSHSFGWVIYVSYMAWSNRNRHLKCERSESFRIGSSDSGGMSAYVGSKMVSTTPSPLPPGEHGQNTSLQGPSRDCTRVCHFSAETQVGFPFGFPLKAQQGYQLKKDAPISRRSRTVRTSGSSRPRA